jgi:hypothetical protein
MPKIALSGDDTIHVTWTEDYVKHRLPYSRCINGVWEPVIDLISDTAEYPSPFWYISPVTNGQNIYIFACNEWNLKRPILMLHSSNGGSTWQSPTRISSDTAVGLFSTNLYRDTMVIVYSPWDNGFSQQPVLMYSVDLGKTWTHTKDTLDGWTRTALTPGTLHLVRDVFVGGAQEKLYMRSFDLGNTWVDKETLSTVDGYSAHEHAIASYNGGIDSARIMMAWRDEKYGCFGGYGLGCSIIERETNDNGTQWKDEEILTNEPRGLNPAIDLNDSSAVIVWYHDLQIDKFHLLIRARLGRSNNWSEAIDLTPFTEYAGATALPAVAISRKAIYVLWQEMIGESIRRSQIFYRRGVFLTTDVKENNKELPEGFLLSQNYPNPFNPSTIIKYKVPSTEYISIKVYDVFGREVATLVNEKLSAGEHSVDWDAGGFASGVYFVRMNGGNYFATTKAILMR